MKKTMLWAIMAVVAIVLMSSFGFNIGGTVETLRVPAEYAGNELYVCPAADSTWDTIAGSLKLFTRPIMIMFFFVVMLLAAVWGWAMYQNLLKDKFDAKSFKNPWAYTKLTFWAAIIIVLLTMTPNYFRTVHLKNNNSNWILCDNNTPGALPVHASMVTE